MVSCGRAPILMESRDQAAGRELCAIAQGEIDFLTLQICAQLSDKHQICLLDKALSSLSADSVLGVYDMTRRCGRIFDDKKNSEASINSLQFSSPLTRASHMTSCRVQHLGLK